MAITTNDLKNGMSLNLSEGLYQVVEFQHVKPGKGGAFVRTTLRNVRTGNQLEKTFRAGEKVEQAMIDKREMQYLYNDGSDYVFMDTETYEQLNVAPVALGSAAEIHLADGASGSGWLTAAPPAGRPAARSGTGRQPHELWLASAHMPDCRYSVPACAASGVSAVGRQGAGVLRGGGTGAMTVRIGAPGASRQPPAARKLRCRSGQPPRRAAARSR